MARKPRIYFPGAVYHVMVRGNDKQNIFFNEFDRQQFCSLLQENVERHHCKIHAFCLMNNHVHLAIQVSDICLSRIMQNICYRYAKWINIRYHRIGHLFQGRFKAILVDADAYLKTLIRYIHLNPVRAQLVKDPCEFWWSSHQDYLAQPIHSWVYSDWVLSQFHSNRQVATRLYQSFIYDELHQISPQLSKGNIDQDILGDKHFIEEIERLTHINCTNNINRETIIKFVCAQYQLKESELLSKSRSHKYSEPRTLIIWLLKELKISTLTEAAALFQKELSGFSQKIKVLSQQHPHLLNKLLEQVKNLSLTPYCTL